MGPSGSGVVAFMGGPGVWALLGWSAVMRRSSAVFWAPEESCGRVGRGVGEFALAKKGTTSLFDEKAAHREPHAGCAEHPRTN